MSAVTYINATDVRKDFSATIDNTVHCKPQFIRRTHNHMIFIEEGEFNRLLSAVTIPVQFIREDDGTYIVTNPVIEDVFSIGETREEALEKLQTNPYDTDQMEQDKEYIAKKLGISTEEFDEIIASPKKTPEDYKNMMWLIRFGVKVCQILGIEKRNMRV